MITCQVYGRIAGTKAAEYAFIHAGKAGKNRGEEEMEKLLKCCYYDTEVDF